MIISQKLTFFKEDDEWEISIFKPLDKPSISWVNPVAFSGAFPFKSRQTLRWEKRKNIFCYNITLLKIFKNNFGKLMHIKAKHLKLSICIFYICICIYMHMYILNLHLKFTHMEICNICNRLCVTAIYINSNLFVIIK